MANKANTGWVIVPKGKRSLSLEELGRAFQTGCVFAGGTTRPVYLKSILHDHEKIMRIKIMVNR